MKTKIIPALFALLFVSSCTTVEQKEPAPRTTSTTTTEQTTVHRPFSSTVERQTTQSY